MAIAALSVDGDVGGSPACPEQSRRALRRARALGVASRFAAGHALLLGIGAGLIVLIGWSIPPHVERGGEMLGGALLIVMGLVTLQHLFAHRTAHPAPSTTAPSTAARSTEHAARSTGHSHLPTMIGAAVAVSTLRALATLPPCG